MSNHIDRTNDLPCNIWLSVKYTNNENPRGFSWCNYQIPVQRKDGSYRSYGDLYFYFISKKGFRMAMGYILEESDCKMIWIAYKRIFYFDKVKLIYSLGGLDKPLKEVKPPYRDVALITG